MAKPRCAAWLRRGAGGAVGVLLAASLALSGCAASTDGGDVADSSDDAATADASADAEAADGFELDADCVVAAASDMTGATSSDGLAVVLSAEVDESISIVYLSVNAAGLEVLAAVADAEELCRALSDAAVQAQADRLRAEGDDDGADAAEALLTDADDGASRGGGLGVLYETYGLVASVDDDAGTLDLDGERPAGSEGAINWQ